jgi:hypothetical protein
VALWYPSRASRMEVPRPPGVFYFQLSPRPSFPRPPGKRSMSNVQENGVPQGSVLSVTLFAIAINSVARAIGPHVSTSLYVDDVAISYASTSMDTIERRLQLTINRLSLGVVKRLLFLCREDPMCPLFAPAGSPSTPCCI